MKVETVEIQLFDFDLSAISDIAVRAGLRALAIRGTKSYESSIKYKADKSPLTSADIEADEIIGSSLEDLYPGIPVLSEERPIPPYRKRKDWRRLWMVDPIDGTKEFMKGRDEWTVNIALIEDGRPVIGVVYVPVAGGLYFGGPGGAFKRLGDGPTQRIETRKDIPGQGLRAVMPKHNLSGSEEAFLSKNPISDCKVVRSSLKFCLIAEGSADVYYRDCGMNEWDMAAGQAVVERAGGAVLSIGGGALSYNTRRMESGPFMCIGSPSLAGSIVFK